MKVPGIFIKLKYAYRAIKAINQPHLGDVVTYKNVPCFLIQGVAKPYWDLLPLSEMDKQNHRTRWDRVHESLFKLEPLYKRFRKSFMFTYQFYMDKEMSNTSIPRMTEKRRICGGDKVNSCTSLFDTNRRFESAESR